jgi:hypothetical protein
VSESAADRLAAIRAQLPPACNLLAVSKGQPAAAIRELAELGQRSFGESRLQEATSKQAELADLGPLDWHFIGHLQANKVRPVLKQFAWVHSVDSLALAQRVARIAVEEALNPRVFLQVKLRPDPSKGGFEPEELRRVWPELQALEGLQLVGLMTMAPLGLQLPERQSLFAGCAELARELQLEQLSMGMSGDWREAAAAGSSWVRIGSALFGPKPLSVPVRDAI